MNLFRRRPKSTLLREAVDETVRMLQMGQEMFQLVTNALVKDTPPEDVKTIKAMDKKMNRMHRDVRRKVYEHLSLTGTRELFSALTLLLVVDDTERVGDYDKNIAEIIEVVPRRLDFGEYAEPFNDIWRQTNEFFDATIEAFRDDNEERAAYVLDAYGRLSDVCDDIIEQVLAGDGNDSIRRDLVALILLMRFFKRVNAHLKNIASTTINPFHRIGYRPKRDS